MMRAKFLVQSVSKMGESEVISMSAVTDKPYGPQGESEDNTYARYTPAGSLSITINNPALIGKIKQGQKYYLDFTEATQ